MAFCGIRMELHLCFIHFSGAVIAVVYMRIFLPQLVTGVGISGKEIENEALLEKGSSENPQFFKTTPSFSDTISLLRSSSTFTQAAIVTFFGSLAEVGLYASLLYYLKAQFHYNKDQFADLMVINGIARGTSQVPLMYNICWQELTLLVFVWVAFLVVQIVK